jgi:hypothetical protein
MVEKGVKMDEQIEKVNMTACYDVRIAQKTVLEEKLWAKIMPIVPWEIEVSSKEQDMKGIDATYCKLRSGLNVTPKKIQLKTRDSGDDILVELIAPWEGMKSAQDIKWNGRDGRTNVDKYFCLDTKNILRIIDAPYLKSLAQNMALKFIEAFKKKPSIKGLKVETGEIKIVKEPGTELKYNVGKVDKMVVFIDPAKIVIQYKFAI